MQGHGTGPGNTSAAKGDPRRLITGRVSSLLLNAAVWRHHVDGRGRDCANSSRREFDCDVVDIKIQNRRVLIQVFGMVFVHGIDLQIQSQAFVRPGSFF